jgi:hypothetical protein
MITCPQCRGIITDCFLKTFCCDSSPLFKATTFSSHSTNIIFVLFFVLQTVRGRGSSGSIVSDYGLDDRAIEVRSPTGADFLLAPVSRPALRPTQPLIHWVPKGIKCGRGMTLTTHPHLVPRLRMSRSYTSSPPMCLHGV